MEGEVERLGGGETCKERWRGWEEGGDGGRGGDCGNRGQVMVGAVVVGL